MADDGSEPNFALNPGSVRILDAIPSVRDMFAMNVLPAVFVVVDHHARELKALTPQMKVSMVAEMAYEVADAMLAARKKEPNVPVPEVP